MASLTFRLQNWQNILIEGHGAGDVPVVGLTRGRERKQKRPRKYGSNETHKNTSLVLRLECVL
jgi:hypothetical protein